MDCVCVAELQTICKEFFDRMWLLEGDKWDLERQEALKKLEVNTHNQFFSLMLRIINYTIYLHPEFFILMIMIFYITIIFLRNNYINILTHPHQCSITQIVIKRPTHTRQTAYERKEFL